MLGDPRSNQNPALLAFSILWFRYHNILAKEIQDKNPDWPDEEVFQKARRYVIAILQVRTLHNSKYYHNFSFISLSFHFILLFLILQNIIAYEYIPAFLGESLPEYTGYKVDVHPGISHVFQTAAFRFGHTLIPPGIYRRDGQCNFRKTPNGNLALRLCSHWWDSNVRKFSFTTFASRFSILLVGIFHNCRMSYQIIPLKR